MKVAGIDGCRGGWIAAVFCSDTGFSFHYAPTLKEILDTPKGWDLVLVDMPIGLVEDATPRSCDGLARKRLGKRASSVFTPPCRRALAAADHKSASAIQKEVTGKGLSIQSFHLFPKIREVDLLMRSDPGWIPVVGEAHPELAFLAFGGKTVVSVSKRTDGGRQLREGVIRGLVAGADLRQAYGICGKKVAKDDLLDAWVLCLAATLPEKGRILLPEPPETDSYGIPMTIRMPDENAASMTSLSIHGTCPHA